MTKSSRKNINKVNTSVNKSKVLENLRPIIEETADELNLTVIDVTFNREHGKYFLRIFIYSPESPISHGDCSDMSRLLSSKIDDLDLLDFPFSLEVSSPGVNRKLKNPIEYSIFKGKEVKITLKKPLNDEDKKIVFTGILIGLSDDHENVLIELNNETRELNLNDVKTLQLEG